MSKFDSRQRGRFSHVGAPPRGPQQLGYVPVVKSAVVDEDESWRDLKRADVDPTWDTDAHADDSLPLPDGDLPLPEGDVASEDASPSPGVELGRSLGDGDLPLPDLGNSVADGDLPLPRGLGTHPDADLSDHELARMGVVPPAPASRPVGSPDGLRASLLAARPSTPRTTPEPDPFGGDGPGTRRYAGVPLDEPSPRASRSEPWGQPAQSGGTARFSALPEAPDGRSRGAAARSSLGPGQPAGRSSLGPGQPAGRSSPGPGQAAGRSSLGPRAPAPAAALPPPEDPFAHDLPVEPEPLFAAGPAAEARTPAPVRTSLEPGRARQPADVRTPAPARTSLEPGHAARPVATHTPGVGFQPPGAAAGKGRPPPPPVPGRPGSTPNDDVRASQARTLIESGRVDEGFALLEQIVAHQPDHEPSRLMLLELCFRLPRASKVMAHAEWVLVRLISLGRPADAVELYRRVRTTFHELVLSERMLLVAVEAADRATDAQAVLDAAKLLVHVYPANPLVTRVLFKVAEYQIAAERPDLGRSTLEYIVANYPDDALAQAARQRIASLG